MSNRTFGVEIECNTNLTDAALAALITAAGVVCVPEGYNHQLRTHWKVVSDGSIGRGWEVVSPVLAGEAGLEALGKVMRAMEAAGCTVSHKCGLHVHIGARELTLAGIKRFCQRWIKFEDSMDMLVAPSRRGTENYYCQGNLSKFGPINTEENRIQSARIGHQAIANATSMAALIQVMCGNTRYWKLNLQAFLRHGTMEVRMHQGTVNAEKAINWVRLIDALVTYAYDEAATIVPRRHRGDDRKRLGWMLQVAAPTVRAYWKRRALELAR